MARSSDPAPPLGTILLKLALNRKLDHLTLCRTSNPAGSYQAAHKPHGASGYKVAVNDDPVIALTEALSPNYSVSWEDHLFVLKDDFDHLI